MSDSDPQVNIVKLEGTTAAPVAARFQPGQLQIDKPVPWTVQPASRGDVPDLKFTTAHGRVLSIRLLFEGSATGASVQPDLDRLSRMTKLMSETSSAAAKRPPRIRLHWPGGHLPQFEGVIESLSIHYLAFLPDGKPVGATAELRVREADDLMVGKPT